MRLGRDLVVPAGAEVAIDAFKERPTRVPDRLRPTDGWKKAWGYSRTAAGHHNTERIQKVMDISNLGV